MDKSNSTARNLTSGALLARNGVIDLIGQGVPLLAALVAIPLLIRGLGIDRFGVLTLAWMVIGYFSLFDLGLGRALTQLVAEKLGAGEEAQIPPLVWTALSLMFVLGLCGALAMSAISAWLVHSVLKIPGPLQAEALNALYLLAAAIPVVIITAGLAGILAAQQRFGALNAIRIPMGIYGFLAPLLVLPFSQDMFLISAVLVLGRVVTCGVHFAVCFRVMPALRSGFVLQCAAIKPLFRFGAWMTVTNVIGPLMVYLDRFVIGAVVSVAAVAYYATPYDMVTKLWIIPYALAGVLFPAFAASHKQGDKRTEQLYVRGTKYVALALFPVVLVVTAFAHEGLQWWLGDEFSLHSAPVMQWLAIGVFINCLALVSITLIQGVGRPDLSAKLHCFELPIYLPLLWWAIHNYGIQGAAIAWVGRVALDGVVLFWLSIRFLGSSTVLSGRMAAGMLVALGGLMAPLLADSFTFRAVTVAMVLAVFALATWFTVLATDERKYVRDQMLGLTNKEPVNVG